MQTSGKLYAIQNWIHISISCNTCSGSKSMHQKSFTQHKHSYMQAGWQKWHLRFGPNLLDANQFQARPNLLHTRSWDGGTHISVKRKNLANSCSRISFQMIPFYACRIPLASFESWDFGPKIGLHGLDGLAQVWTAFPPYVWFYINDIIVRYYDIIIMVLSYHNNGIWYHIQLI